MGSVEGGFVVTTINPAYTSKEMSRQFLSCQPKAIICSTENYNVVKTARDFAQLTNVFMITMKSPDNKSNPDNTVHFDELMNTDGK